MRPHTVGSTRVIVQFLHCGTEVERAVLLAGGVGGQREARGVEVPHRGVGAEANEGWLWTEGAARTSRQGVEQASHRASEGNGMKGGVGSAGVCV